MRQEIQDLKKNLSQKNSFITTAEKLASLQLYNASNQINNLTRILTTQVCNQMSFFQAPLMKYFSVICIQNVLFIRLIK